MSKQVNFHKEAFFIKDCLRAHIKIKSKDILNSLGYINNKKKIIDQNLNKKNKKIQIKHLAIAYTFYFSVSI